MENIIDNVIELQNGNKYFVLNQGTYREKNYYFVIKVNDEETDFENEGYFVEEVNSDPLTLVKVKDKELLNVLIRFLAFKVEQ